MDIRKFMKRKSISDRRSVENNSDKIFQNWVLFNQKRLMREPQTYLLIFQVHFRLSCVNIRQFCKICNKWQKVHPYGEFVYSSTWKRFQNSCEWSACFHGAVSLWCRNSKAFVNLHLHCNVSNLKKLSKMSTLHHPRKIYTDSHGYFQQTLTYGQVRLNQGSPTFSMLRATSWYRLMWSATGLTYTLLK